MDFQTVIRSRRSCRSYTGEAPEMRALGQILEAGCSAPVGRRKYEDVSLTVIQNKALLSAISENAKAVLGMEQDPLYGAPVMILVSVRETEGQILPVKIADAACVMENMHLQATELGLGSCYIWSATQAIQQNPELLYRLELQDGFWPVSALIVGSGVMTAEERGSAFGRIKTNYLD